MSENIVKKSETDQMILCADQLLLDENNIFDQITVRSSGSKQYFHTFDEKKLACIASAMPEINRATRTLGRKNTQTTGKLMTLTMLADTSPFRVIRQCLAQIETKRAAVKENRFKLLRDKVNLQKLKEDILNEGLTNYELQLLEIDIEELTSKINDTFLYIEGALKDIALYQSVYAEVRESKNISENWDEEDAEKEEVQHHLRMAFLHAYRDILSHGALGMGTLEYLQQFGVHPHVAKAIVEGYIVSCNNNLKDGDIMDYEDLETFLDGVVNEFKDEYKKVLNRLGLKSLYETWYMYKE